VARRRLSPGAPPREAPADLLRWRGWARTLSRTEHSMHVLTAHSREDPVTGRLLPCGCDLCEHSARLRVG